MQDIWDKRISKKTRIIFWVVGILLITICSCFFYKNYNQNYEFKYLTLAACSVFTALGLEFVIINFNLENRVVKAVLLVLLGAYIGASFNNEYIRTGGILLLFCVLFFIIVALTKNIFSTLLTFTMISIPFVIGSGILINQFPDKANAAFYIVIAGFFLFYRIVGVRANKAFIGRWMGYPSEANKYNFRQLKEQINFIYIVTFIAMNIGNWFVGSNYEVASILNNAFITGVAITNMNWRRIFWFTKKEFYGSKEKLNEKG